MTLQVDKAGLLSLCNELCIKLVIACNERNVHKRTILAVNGSLEHLGAVEEIIDNSSLLLVESLHSLKTALLLYPLKYQTKDIDGVCRRCVVHRTIVCVGLVVEHCRSDILCIADKILTDNNNGKTGRAHILLCACIDHSELAYVNRFGKNAGRHISYQRNAYIGDLSPLCTVNGVVEADVEIVSVCSALVLVDLGDIREGLILEEATALQSP